MVNNVKKSDAIYKEMIRLQEATGNHRLSVGNYAKSWDGLGVSVSQVVRELPAAAVSLNTFFLGISNNIPIVIDEIKKVREQNKALADYAHTLGLNVWIYCGKTYEQLKEDELSLQLLKSCDVLVDGPFIYELRDITLPFRGSSNQRIIDIQKSLKQNKIILWEC